MLLVWLGQLKWLGGQYTGNLENYLTTAEIINKVDIKVWGYLVIIHKIIVLQNSNFTSRSVLVTYL